MKKELVVNCPVHGLKTVYVDTITHMEFSEELPNQFNSISRYTAKCPICGKRLIGFEKKKGDV